MYILLTEEEILNNPNYYDLGKLIHSKYWKMKESENLLDECVLCGEKSPYSKNTHVDYRLGYIEGVGQTCFKPLKCEKR